MKEVALQERNSFIKRILGFFGLNRSLARSSQPKDGEYVHANISADYCDGNSRSHALREAEHNMTEALLERQRRSFT